MTFRNQTHTNKWNLSESYNEDWKQRSFELFDLFKEHEYKSGSNYQVAEYGCGAYSPIYSLLHGKDGFEVCKSDIKKWDDHTQVLDLNADKVILSYANISVFSGVLEYLNDVPKTLKNAMFNSDYLLISYAFMSAAVIMDEVRYLKEIGNRAVNCGWRNHYTIKDIVELVSDIGVISASRLWNNNQSLFLIRNYKMDKL